MSVTRSVVLLSALAIIGFACSVEPADIESASASSSAVSSAATADVGVEETMPTPEPATSQPVVSGDESDQATSRWDGPSGRSLPPDMVDYATYLDDIHWTFGDCLDKDADLVDGDVSWRYCRPTETLEFLRRDDPNGSGYAAHTTFVIQNGALVIGQIADGVTWHVDLLIQNEELVVGISNGHGPTELDDWDGLAVILDAWANADEVYSQLREA